MDSMSETELLLSKFAENFGNYKSEKVAIYGIGIMTNAILQAFPNFNIVGLMDETRAGESIYGKAILSENAVAELGVKTIIIVATANNTNIIFRRITRFCKENGIDVYTIDGSLLSWDTGSEKSDEKYADISFECLQGKIKNVDVVSFDVFDTLIMRKTLYPRDIFHILAKRMGISAFYAARIKAETELYPGKDIRQIYCGVAQLLELNDKERDKLMNTELLIEKEMIVPRKSMLAALEYALSLGKAVYFVSDMYLPNEIMCEILTANDIQATREQILVSCDYGVGKFNGLFLALREKVGKNRILHIGDNSEVDIVSAQKYGMDCTFKLFSACDMLADSNCAELLTHTSKLSDRLTIGRFIATQLNNPFLFAQTGGKFCVANDYELGQSFFAPIIFNYVVWLRERVKNHPLDYIFCSSRDGWLIKRIIDETPELRISFPPLIYYYTSRITSMRDILIDQRGILEVLKIKHAGTPVDILTHTFQLKNDEILPWQGEEGGDAEGYVLKHKNAIFETASKTLKNNRGYINNLQIPPRSKIGYVDFVSSGTTQLALQKNSDFDIIGLYFLRLNGREFVEDKNALKIESLFARQSFYFFHSLLLNYYTELENILTSFEPTVDEFADNGTPIFAPEKRSAEFFPILREIHRAILDYCKELEFVLFEDMTNTVSELIFSYLHEKYSKHCSAYFKHNTVYDDVPGRELRIFGNQL
jgi:FMN phosphatase YigB (HAD superfamily)